MKQLSSSVPKKQHFAASVLNSAGVGAEVGQEAMSGQRALKWGVGGARPALHFILFLSPSREAPHPSPSRRGHLHNAFTSEGRSQTGNSWSLRGAAISTIAIRSRNRTTGAVEIQLLSCGWMEQKNLWALNDGRGRD